MTVGKALENVLNGELRFLRHEFEVSTVFKDSRIFQAEVPNLHLQRVTRFILLHLEVLDLLIDLSKLVVIRVDTSFTFDKTLELLFGDAVNARGTDPIS